MLKGFRDLIMRGNVIDLAVAVIIGAAFTKVVNSLVEDIIMPPIGLVLGNVDFSKLKYVMQAASLGPDGKEIPPTGKSFDVDFCTVARWDQNGQIIEENLFYDLVSFMKQIGIGG